MPLVAANGIELFYDEFGSPDDPPVLLVMGYTAQMTGWLEDFCTMLADHGLRVIRYDNRDVGLSTKTGYPLPEMAPRTGDTGPLFTLAKPPPYTLSDMAADGIGLLDTLGIEKAHVVGASMGGMIVQLMAINHPDRVLTLTSVMSSTGNPEVGQGTPEALAVLMSPQPEDRDAFIERASVMGRVVGGPLFDEALVRERAGLNFDRSFYPIGALYQMAAIMSDGDRTERLAGVKCPTLVIHGGADTLIVPSGGEATAKAIPGAEHVVFEEMGHNLPKPLWPEITSAIAKHVARGMSADRIGTVAELMRVHGRNRADKPAITSGDRTWTYGEADSRSNQAAQALAAEGIGPEDRVAFLDKNTIPYFELLFGGGKLNAVNVAVNWRLAPPEVAQIVNDAQAKVFVVGQEFVKVLDEIEGDLPSVKKFVVVGGHPKHQDYEEWVSAHPADDPGVEPTPDDIAFQLYTSGTTGLPKGVMLTNSNLFSLLPVAAADWGYNEDSVNLVAMPLFHIGGSGVATIGLFAGGHSILMREVNPVEMLELIPTKGVTNMFAVPAVLQFMVAAPGVGDIDFSSLTDIIYGASPISVEVLTKSMATFGCRFHQAYGLTETTGAIVWLRPEDHDPGGPNEHRLRAAGKPMGGVELPCVTAEGVDVPVGEVGEIWVRTGQNMKGYWRKPEETAATITADGWLKTGDAGYLDEDGYLFIHDRVKDMIISGGENIYPAEVENALMSHPAVADVAAFGIPHDKWGETVMALVVKEPGTDPTPEEIITFARERLADFKCPTKVDFADSLPRNPSGKILRRELRTPFWEGRERGVN